MGIKLHRAKVIGTLAVVLVALTPLGANASEVGPSTSSAQGTPATSQFQENRNLTEDEVLERTLRLNARYDTVGDILNSSDAEFIRIYAGTPDRVDARTNVSSSGPVVSPMMSSTYPYSKSGSGAGGSGSIKGSLYLYTKDFTWENRYKGSITASGSAAVTKIKACFNVRSYGTVGQTGVGIVYSDDPCQTKAGRSLIMSRDKTYSAFVVYSTITANAIFYTSRGSFQVNS